MKPCISPNPRNGFALVVTLSLMILLTVVAVGLLTLSSISLRSSSSALAMAEARSNARLAVQLALGQLQLTTGQDTRVTASSNVIDDIRYSSSVVQEPPATLTGAWRSWEGTDHDTTGKPVIPDYTSKIKTGNPHEMPGVSSGGGRFLGWLTSTTDPEYTDLANKATTGFVAMVATGSTPDPERKVYMKPVPVNASRGSFAWWTSGENSKAMINTDRIAKPATIVQWQQRVRSNGRADAMTFNLANVSNLATGKTIPSTGNLKLVNPAADLRKVHDLTGFSRGLLTNTATGGWRRDLSLFSERFILLPATQLPLFTLKPGSGQTYSKANPSTHPANPLIYPWAKYSGAAGSDAFAQVPPICSWTALTDYMLQYQDLSTSSATKTAMPAFMAPYFGSTNRFNFQDQIRRTPVVARIQWIYSLCSTAEGTNYRPGFLLTPVLTLWNPYNVEINVSSFRSTILDMAPLVFEFSVGGTRYRDSSLQQICGNISLRIDQSITLPPGTSRVYSLNNSNPQVVGSYANGLALTAGYKPNGGFLFYGLDRGSWTPPVPAGTVFAIENISYAPLSSKDGVKKGIGSHYDLFFSGVQMSAHRMMYDVDELGGPAGVASLYPPLNERLSTTVGEVEGIKNKPFATATFGYRMASPMSRDPRHKHLSSKGMLQANPLCFYSEVGFSLGTTASMAGTGVNHPINAPYDFMFQDMNGWNDTLAAPQFESGTNSSYIVSGLTAGDGLTRSVMAELPTRPLQSLAELQHFDARNNNPIPPFQFNLIGNGSAHPIFAPNQVTIPNSHYAGMCNDDTYLLNHLLFDDWFVSSIAVDLHDFTRIQKRSINDVYKDHLELTTPLPNRFYLPARGAKIPTVAQAVSDAVSNSKNASTNMYAFESIASKLEVEGMFNINSVSLEAWKAILRQSRDLQVPYLAASGGTISGSASSFAYPRSSISGDQGSNSGSKASGATFPEAAEFAGYRVLTDTQIDALAGEIVSEIRKRGPFLSLGEFVNRQLTTDKDLAIASTIQKALDNLAKMGADPKNPFAAIQSIATEITTLPPGKTDYKFPEAALGSSAFGVPGWVRQADILKPLAPIISARDDTFTIRAYGDSRDKANSQKILARAWCEVVVQRNADYVDPRDHAAVAPFSTQMKSDINKRFGRRYEIVSFRWLSEAEL